MLIYVHVCQCLWVHWVFNCTFCWSVRIYLLLSFACRLLCSKALVSPGRLKWEQWDVCKSAKQELETCKVNLETLFWPKSMFYRVYIYRSFFLLFQCTAWATEIVIDVAVYNCLQFVTLDQTVWLLKRSYCFCDVDVCLTVSTAALEPCRYQVKHRAHYLYHQKFSFSIP